MLKVCTTNLKALVDHHCHLKHSLIICTLMYSLHQFDPTSAIEYWMRQKNRRPKSSETRREQEWFYGVFVESASGRKRKLNPKIQF